MSLSISISVFGDDAWAMWHEANRDAAEDARLEAIEWLNTPCDRCKTELREDVDTEFCYGCMDEIDRRLWLERRVA